MVASADLDDVIGDLIKKVYEEKVKAGDVDAASWKATTEEYWKAIKQGWDKTPAYFTKGQLAMLELRRNVNMFAAFKNHANIIELTQKLTGPDGQPLSFSKFKEEAKAIDEKYNQNWLKAEYNYAVNAARSAAQWIGFTQRGGKLEYKTIGDGRVRDEHRKLEGTILPVDHPFWSLYYPPNGWNCRCFVRWRSDDTQEVPPTSFPDVKEMFKNNVGITSQIFTNSHPFISEIGATQAEKIKRLSETETMRWERTFIAGLAKENLLNKSITLSNGDFKGTVLFNSKGIEKAINQPHEDYLEKNRAVLRVESLLKNAEYLGEKPEDKGRPHLVKYHYFASSEGQKTWLIVLREYDNGEIVFYSIVDKVR